AVMQPTAEVAALNSGELDFLANVPSAMQGAESGLPLKVVLVTSDFPNQLLIGAKDIKTPADLRGKVVAGSTPGSEPNQVTAALLEKYGLADGSYQFLSGGNSDDTRATMVANNNAKAALLGLAAAIRMLNDGYPLLDDATKFETVAEGLATSADKIAKQHDMVQRTIDATLEAMQVMRTDQQSILPILQKEFGFSAADAEKAFGLLANRWTPDGRPTATAIQTQFDLDVKDQHLAQRPKESDLFDFSLLHASSS
ncbi:MAG TPA: ABC transporter substrate-binding protein, partial [Chloroflexota bacterium]|nr:ABC transporter substrate-binding protein [Chloroflexota bacterium]